MSRHTGSGTSADKAWLKLYAAVAVLPLALAACGGGGGGSSPADTPSPTPAPAPAATLSVAASATSTVEGGSAVTLTATVTNSTATPTWSLNGPGTLSATSGTSVTYTPPASGSLSANGAAIVSASLTGATTQSVTILVTLSAAVAGVNWNTVTAPAAGNLQAVDYADSRWVAVSDSGAALTSTDAATWTAAAPFGAATGVDAYAVTHFGTTFVAAGSSNTTAGIVASSADGVTWTTGTLPSGATPLHGFIVGTTLMGLGESGHVYASTDGATWSSLATLTGAGTLNAGAYLNGLYLAVGNSGYMGVSTNAGANWSVSQVIKDSSGAGINLHAVTWTGSQFVVVGDNGAISTSANGLSWSTLKTSAITGTLRSVSTSADGTIVVVGDDGIETSTDGSTWTARNGSTVSALNGVTFANSMFVAVGPSSLIQTSVATQP